MRILGADLARARRREAVNTLALLDERGNVSTLRQPASLAELAAQVGELADDEPFILAANIPLVTASSATRSRPVENLSRRRFGYRINPPARGTAESPGIGGEALLAALAAAGHPCLPYPDRDRRRAGLAEIHPGLVIKALVWENVLAAVHGNHPFREEIFRAYAPPSYRLSDRRARESWADRLARLDLLMKVLGPVAGFDFRPAREALSAAASDEQVERAASVLDASLIAGAARRYLESPEACVFLGDRERGYAILPADGLIRRLALHDAAPERGQLFPRASLSERLGDAAEIRAKDLLDVPGRPQRLEAVFRESPLYEFDNRDEMLWWKHCRHLAGPVLPTDGLNELQVKLGRASQSAPVDGPTLRLVRSRHRTLSFRFDPPSSWRTRLPTRDGRTYPFLVVRATYEALAASE